MCYIDLVVSISNVLMNNECIVQVLERSSPPFLLVKKKRSKRKSIRLKPNLLLFRLDRKSFGITFLMGGITPHTPREHKKLQVAFYKRGVRGEGSAAAGSPRSYTARIDLCDKGPWRALVPHEAQRAE